VRQDQTNKTCKHCKKSAHSHQTYLGTAGLAGRAVACLRCGGWSAAGGVGSSILRTGSQWTWLLLIPSSLNFKEGGCWPAAPQCKILHVLIPRIMSPTFPALGRFTYVWTYIAVVAAAAAAVLTVILTVPWTPLPEVTFTVPSANSTRRIFFSAPLFLALPWTHLHSRPRNPRGPGRSSPCAVLRRPQVCRLRIPGFVHSANAHLCPLC